MTIYHLRGTDGTEVFTGTIEPPPGSGSQPGVLASVDFLFTEETTAGVYTATWNPPAGCTVTEARFYLLKPWAADAAAFAMGDADKPAGYATELDIIGSGGLNNAPYDPTNRVGNSSSAETLPGGQFDAADYQDGAFPALIQAGPVTGPPSGGVLYGSPSMTYGPANGPITMTLTTTIGSPPVVATGTALVKIVYFTPVTAVTATFA